MVKREPTHPNKWSQTEWTTTAKLLNLFPCWPHIISSKWTRFELKAPFKFTSIIIQKFLKLKPFIRRCCHLQTCFKVTNQPCIIFMLSSFFFRLKDKSKHPQKTVHHVTHGKRQNLAQCATKEKKAV